MTALARYGRFPPSPRGTQRAADHGRRRTRASSRSCIAEVDDLEEERGEKRSLRTRMEEPEGLLRGQTILVERVSSCREAVEGIEEVRLFQVQGLEVVEPLTPTSVPFRSDFKEGIDQRCFSLLAYRISTTSFSFQT